MVKFPSFSDYWTQKTAYSQQDCARHFFASSLFLRKYATISPYFPFSKSRKKSRAGFQFWLSYALSHTFFPKKYLINSTRPFHKGRAAKYFLVT